MRELVDLLGPWREAGELSAAEVHVAATLGRLAGEARAEVLLAAALAARAPRYGDVCIDLRTVSPLDEVTILESVARTRRAVIVHEATRNCGVGAEVASRIHENLHGQLLAPVQRLGSAFCPVPFSKPLETAFVPGAQGIEGAIRRTLE